MKSFYKRKLPHFTPKGYAFFITARLYGSLPVKVIEKLKLEKQKNEIMISQIDNLEKRKQQYFEFQRIYFDKFDSALDNYSNGPYWLKIESIAQIVKEALHFRDGKVYDLFAYTIMPNHIHIVIKPILNQYSRLGEENDRETNYDDIERVNVRGRDFEQTVYDQHEKIKGSSIGQPRRLSNDKNVGRKKPSSYILGDIMESLKGYTAFECNKILKRKGPFWQHESYDHVIRNREELVKIVHYILNNPVKARLCENPEDWKWNYYNSDLINL